MADEKEYKVRWLNKRTGAMGYGKNAYTLEKAAEYAKAADEQPMNKANRIVHDVIHISEVPNGK